MIASAIKLTTVSPFWKQPLHESVHLRLGYSSKLQPKLRTCSRSVQEIHLGHLSGLDKFGLQTIGLNLESRGLKLHKILDILS